MGLRLASKRLVDAVPDLQQAFEQEASAASSWIKNEVLVGDIKEGDSEASELSHGEILAKAPAEDRAEELLKRLAYTVDVSARERYILEGADDV